MKIKTVKVFKSPLVIGALVVAVSMAYVMHVKAFYSFSSWLWNLRSQPAVTALVADTGVDTDAIQIALLLDTSNSMDGLIEQAKSQLWKIINELSRVEKDDATPDIQIALYEYGNDRLSARQGHIQQVSPFTTDLDLISEKLFALTTNGGHEYCGEVIHKSLQELRWGNTNGLKMIYIAGNESFGQGDYSFERACKEAKQKDVLINTIFCGSQAEGIELQWKKGAYLTDGEYMNIDHNARTVYIQSPFDDRISALNQKLNSTYIPYGVNGTNRLKNMAQQDANAFSLSKEIEVERAVCKSKKAYSNSTWDLIDAFKKDKKILKDKAQLPDQYKGKSEQEIEEAITAMTAEREAIQKEMKELDEKRRAFINEKEATMDTSDETLEKSILKSVKAQAKKKGYKVE